MMIGLQASEVDPRVQILKTLENDSSQQRSYEQSEIQLKTLADLLQKYPEMAQDSKIFISAINRDVDPEKAVKLLLQNGADLNNPSLSKYSSPMKFVIGKLASSRTEDNKRKYQSIFKTLMKHGGKIDDNDAIDFTSSIRVPGTGYRSPVTRRIHIRYLPEFATVIDEVKAEDEARALAAFLTEAGLGTRSGNRNTEVAVATNQMFGNSEKSLGL